MIAVRGSASILYSGLNRLGSTCARRYQSTKIPSYENIIYSTPTPKVGLLTLNRPNARNALSSPMFQEINHLLGIINSSPTDIRCLVLTGSDKFFAAGADISEMSQRSLPDVYYNDFIKSWTEQISLLKVPLIGAVSGYALGGGCELAMLCDIILASKDAKFGQPEINLGVIPGGGGTQRLIRAIGKSKAMEYILTGNQFSAQQAYEWGLISRVIDGGHKELLKESLELAESISTKPRLAVKAAKEGIDAAYDLPLTQGVEYERRLFYLLFGTNDQKEGMKAFLEKRKPNFTDS